MDNLEPITRNEMFLNGDDLEPITREEMILAGADLEPITRHEWFLKRYRGGGGGGGYDLVNVPNLPADIASFNDGTDLPMASLKVAVTPYQDLHGYDSPWVGGAGKNKYPIQVGADVWIGNGGGSYVDDNGVLIVTATSSEYSGVYGAGQQASLVNQQSIAKTVSFDVKGDVPATIKVQNVSVEIGTTYQRKSITINPNTQASLSIYGGGTANNIYVKDMMISEDGSIAYEPYSNICPISGWDEADVTVADDVENPTTSHEYIIDLDGTRYGGVLDATNGTMDDTLDYIASYNGETLPSTWISDRDVYAEGTTPTIGAEVVYTRATPITVQLAPTPVKSLEGENNISANCGQITEVKYFKKA